MIKKLLITSLLIFTTVTASTIVTVCDEKGACKTYIVLD